MRYVFPILVALVSFPGHSATVSAPDQVAAPGQVVTLSFAFSGAGQPITGVQFDLQWDHSLDVKLVLGDQLRQSSKVFSSASHASGTITCLIAGLNQDVLPDGELLKAFVVVDSQAPVGQAQVRVQNTFAANANGDPMALDPAAVNIQVTAGSSIPVPIGLNGVLNSASLIAGPVSPGELITLFGGLPNQGQMLLFNGTQAPIIYSGVNQINAVVPFGLDLSTAANMEIRAGGHSTSLSVPVAPASPALFTLADGAGPGAILNQDLTINSASNPAPRGSILVLYGTGFGMVNPQPVDGQITSAAANTQFPVTALISGTPATVTYAGAAPGLVAGVIQVNIQIPTTVAPNLAAPVSLAIAGATTPAIVTASIQ